MQYFRECDPDVCQSCYSHINQSVVLQLNIQIPFCPNTNLLYKVKKRVILGKSLVTDGLGIFAATNFKKNDFIGEYIGDIITNDSREEIYSNAGIQYTFNLSETMVAI